MMLGARGSTLVNPAKHIMRQYQESDIAFHLDHPKSANHNQPGMGKTDIGSEVMDRSRINGAPLNKILVACPNYLTEQWLHHIQEQYPTDKAINASKGTKPQKIESIMSTLTDDTRWVIINKEMFRTLPIIPVYDGVILDESHHYANREAKITKAATELAHSPTVKQFMQLTATPVRKEPDDLFSQLRMLDPETFSSYNEFIYKYCYVQRGRFGTHVRGGRTHAIKEMLKEYAIGHTYNEVHLQLPRLIEYSDSLEPTPAERKLYNEVKLHWRLEAKSFGYDFDNPKYMTNAMQVITFLRRITMNDTKLEAIKDIIEDADDPVVIFTWFRDGAERVANYLIENCDVETNVPIIDGSIKPEDRAAIAKGQRYVVATLASLSEGVDLSHARNVVFAEEYWQPAMMFQALSRVRRWSPTGSNKPVLVHYLQIEDTLDEVIHQVQKSRHATIGGIMKKILDED